jgi:hypothetical protein
MTPTDAFAAALSAAELQVDRMNGLGFAEAQLCMRPVEEFVSRISEVPLSAPARLATISSGAECRAVTDLETRARGILRSAPIVTPADAIAALRFCHEWYERDMGDEENEKLFQRAIEFLDRHPATANGPA